jgi:hypothetical protein
MEYRAMITDRKYVIIPKAQASLIDFSEVLETSYDTLRCSVDGTKTFIKYDGGMPSSVQKLSGRSQEYSHSEMLEILQSEEWVDRDSDMEM